MQMQTFCATIWLITEINILRCTVSKTSKTKGHIKLQDFLDHIHACEFFRIISIAFRPDVIEIR